MSKYSAIKAATNAYIKTNGRQEITGAILNAVMIATIDSLGRFYQFVGNASPDTDPGTIDQNIAYLASTPGTYTKLGGVSLDAGEFAVIKFDGVWKKEVIVVIPAKVSQLENDLGFITNAVSDLVNYYTKTETDTALSNFFTKPEVNAILSGYYDKDEVDSIVSALTGQSYVVAWDGTAEPVVGDIPAGVSVTWGGNPYVGTLPASASTTNKIYLVSNGAGYDEYITTEDGGYSWIGIGTTSIDLSGYVTQDQFSQLEQYARKVFPDEAKHIIVSLFKKIAYISNDVEDDVDELENLLVNGAELVYISANFTPGDVKFYPGQSLDLLKPFLEVTGHYDDLSERDVHNYTLSGTLTAGTSTITITYDEKTTTFDVIVEDVAYYRDGTSMATKVALRASYTSSTKSRAATIDGVTYWFTHAYPAIDSAKSRACYYLFDLLLTAGKTYQFDFYYTGKPNGYYLKIALSGYDEVFRVAGVANVGASSADYSSHEIGSGALLPTDDGEKVTLTYEIPSGAVGVRANFVLYDSNDANPTWPADFIFTKVIITEIENE